MHEGDADARIGELVAQRFGKAAYREFARRIRRLARRRDQAEQARNIDDACFLAVGQERQEGARHLHHAPEIDAEQPIEIAFGNFEEGAAQRHARVPCAASTCAGKAATAERPATSR